MRRKEICCFCIVAIITFITFHSTFLFADVATLSWIPPTTNNDGTPLTDLAGYNVYYGTSSRAYSWSINVGNTTMYTVVNLTDGITYYFAVTVYDESGNESSYSNEVSKAIPSVPEFTLTINKSGTGSGVVTATGIDCGLDCTEAYKQGKIVTLTASPYSGSYFNGWTGGGCSGADMCVISISTDTGTTATFTLLPPIAAFTAYPTAVQTPLYVSFTDSSTNNPTSWSWSFGDGAASTGQNSVHTYKNAGTYTVSFTVSNAAGSDRETKNNYITVSACGNQPVKISGAIPQYYSSIQAAYDAAADGDTIEVQAAELTGNIDINRNISVIIKGGYDCNFSTYLQNTIINGVMTLNGGSLIAEGITIK